MEYLSNQEIKSELTDMLKWFLEFCDRHQLYCVPGGGTMLGVARHQGFIPWDDDIDMVMLRAEYEKLVSFSDILEEESGGRYRLLSLKNEGYEFPFAKMINLNISVRQVNLATSAGDFLWIDIFPIDDVPAEADIRVKFYKRAHTMRLLLESALMKRENVSEESVHNKIKLFLHPFMSFYGAKKLGKKLDAFSMKYSKRNSEYVGGVVWGYGECETMKRTDFLSVDYGTFEGVPVKIMGCWNEYLSNLYGDYMTLPPKDKRKAHELIAWRSEKQGGVV